MRYVVIAFIEIVFIGMKPGLFFIPVKGQFNP
jgi:hypothetical protein